MTKTQSYRVAGLGVSMTGIRPQVHQEADCLLGVGVSDLLSEQVLQDLLSLTLFEPEAVLQQPLSTPGHK